MNDDDDLHETEDPLADTSATYHGRFCGYPGMVWYSKVTKTKGADLQVGDMLDTLDHRGARMIFGIFAGAAPADMDAPTIEHLSDLRCRDVDSGLRTVMVGGGETETVRVDVEYDVVDPDSQVTPTGEPVTDI